MRSKWYVYSCNIAIRLKSSSEFSEASSKPFWNSLFSAVLGIRLTVLGIQSTAVFCASDWFDRTHFEAVYIARALSIEQMWIDKCKKRSIDGMGMSRETKANGAHTLNMLNRQNVQ